MLNQLWCTLAKYTHAHPSHTTTHTQTHTHTRASSTWMRALKTTVDRYDPRCGGPEICLIPFVLRACVSVCVLAYGFFLPAAAAAASAALLPAQCCPFGGCFAWMLLTCCWVLLTLFENWNNGWSWPILFLLGANTLGSAIENKW